MKTVNHIDFYLPAWLWCNVELVNWSEQNNLLHHGKVLNVLNWIWQVSLNQEPHYCLLLFLPASKTCPLCALFSPLCRDAHIKGAVAGCGLLECERLVVMTVAQDLGELSFEERRGERCLTGTACAEYELDRETWTYIWCDHVWRS